MGTPGITMGSRVRGFVRRHMADTRPLAVPAYRRLLFGNSLSYIGIQLTAVSVSAQIYDLTRSSLWVGLAGPVGLVPLVVFGLWGGAVADAMDRRKLLLAGSVASWAATFALLLNALLLKSVWLLLAAVAVQSMGAAVASTTRGAIIPRLVPAELVSSANTLNFLASSMGFVLGPLLGGFVLAGGGFATAYLIDAVLFTSSLYAAVRLPRIEPLGEAAAPGLRAVADGLRYIVANPVVLMSFVVDIIAMGFALPRALLPELTATKFGGSEIAFGWLSAGMPLGSVIGGLVSGWVGRVNRQGLGLIFVIAFWGLAVAAAGVADQLWLVVALLAAGGFADLVSAVWRQTILQTYAPDEMRGRLQGVFFVVVAGGPRLGDLRAGATATSFGVAAAWIGGGLLCAVTVIVVGLAVPAFRDYRARGRTED